MRALHTLYLFFTFWLVYAITDKGNEWEKGNPIFWFFFIMYNFDRLSRKGKRLMFLLIFSFHVICSTLLCSFMNFCVLTLFFSF